MALRVNMKISKETEATLTELFSKEKLKYIEKRIKKIKRKYKIPKDKIKINQKETFLITYADIVQKKGQKHFKTFKQFSDIFLKGKISTIHFLPFYPSTSDGGFSIVGYKKIDKKNGSWTDVGKMSKYHNLMFDAVINHISQKSDWFQKHLKGDKKYKDYFLSFDTKVDTSSVFRPRTSPLLTKFNSLYYWTTFSSDQLDLNFSNPDVFLDILDTLFFYASKGAKYIRLDAIAYLYKCLGKNCVNLPETHKIVRVFREFLPDSVNLISEVNLSLKSILSYFGNGHNESQLVYNFPLAPLTYHALMKSDSGPLNNYFKSIKVFSKKTSYLNFLASHDGIGILPAKSFLTDKQVNGLIADTKKKGFKVSKKTEFDGTKTVYELNINYFDALDRNIDKMLCAHSILFFARGVPAIYFHSLVGSYGDKKYDRKRPRTVNREKLNYNRLVKELNDKKSVKHQIYSNLLKMIEIRKKHKAFHPCSDQIVLSKGKNMFVVKRCSDGNRVTGYHNLSNKRKVIGLSKEKKNILTGEKIKKLILEPYGFAWLS